MKKILLILSTLVVGAMADDDKPKPPNGEVGSKFIKDLNGDGEVNAKKIQDYINKLYSKSIFVAEIIQKTLTAVTNRGDAYTITEDLNLSNKAEALVIILEKNINSLKSNIQGTKFKILHNQTIIRIPTKNIGKKVIISDEKGNTLIEYTIIKN